MNQNAGLQKSSKATASQPTEDQRRIAAVYGLAKMCRETLDNDTMKMWLGILSGFSAAEVEKGVQHFLLNEQKREMPMPAKLLKHIREACGIPNPFDAAQNLKSQAEAEWGQVLDRVRRVGAYGNPRFHTTTERVLRAMGGWSALCESMTSANRDFKRRDFVSMWQTYHETGDAMELGAFGVQQALAERMKQRPAEIPSGWLKRIQ